MLERGSLTLGRIRGIPIRAHWTLLFGAFVFSGFRFEPGFWLGFFLLVLIHELGHAALVRAFRLQVVAIDITGFGGLCHWSGRATERQRGAIAWGGVLAQAALLAVTVAVLFVAGNPHSRFLGELASVFTFTNVYLIGLNLLPIPPLDGFEAWKLVVGLFKGGKGSRRPPPPESSRPYTSSPSDPESVRRLARMLERVGDEARRNKN